MGGWYFCAFAVSTYDGAEISTQKGHKSDALALLATMVLVLRTLLKHENHFVNQTVRFQVQLEADGYFFLGSFRICNRSKQGDLVSTRKFLNLILQIRLQKHLLGFAQTRYSAPEYASSAP